ncbi:hypothetical protein [Haloferax sulfurifontis]|uniref:Uncharacterized protein n=2 Tax=Haloferax sulfurifontis TaxID=255616 RepID=M0III1_9EURY|nr:hypothetical protein [Haloferax sulfurifontis]ELZ96586.1 hypothetical protein C441_04439 [Haloferax sulfurifontis ATCC BAA-897]GGC72661.1 hypothetical protein GCM10007209_38270 [Haloferax sulfurifontis]
MDNLYVALVAALVGLVLAPAILAGGGFIIAIGLVVVILAVLIGGPELLDIYKTKSMGQYSGLDTRDLVQGNGDRRDDE